MWEQYAVGTLAPAQLLHIQKHTLTCEICADIKEGIDVMVEPTKLSQKVKAINREVDLRLANKPQTNKWTIYLAAVATLVITAGLGWYLWNTPQTPMALQNDTHKEAPDPRIPQLREQPVLTSKPEETKETLKKPEDFPADRKTITKPEETIDDVATTPAIQDFSKTVEVDKETNADEAKQIKAPEKELVAGDVSEDVQVTKEIIVAEVATKKRNKKAKYKRETYPAAYSNNNLSNNNFQNNIEDSAPQGIFKISGLPSDLTNYDNAVQHFNALHYDSCRMNLTPIISNPNSLFYEDGLMLLAQTQLKQKQNKEAKATLNQVISLNGKRNKEAADLLKHLE
jgi:TolA-binding protein